MPIIKTKRLILRPLRMADKESLVKHANDKAIAKNLLTLPSPYKLEHAKTWIKKTQKYAKMKKPLDFVFGIEIDGMIVGSIGIHKIAEKHKAEIGYWLGREYWGKGIMSEAVGVVTDFCFKKLQLKRVVARVYSFNPPSKKVLEKNGFESEGLMKKEIFKKGKFIDAYLMAKVK